MQNSLGARLSQQLGPGKVVQDNPDRLHLAMDHASVDNSASLMLHSTRSSEGLASLPHSFLY